MIINLGSNFNDPGATAIDEVDGSVPVTRLGTLNVGSVGVYTLTYTASDSSGNKATPVTRTVLVRDNIPPVITMEGSSPLFLTIGDTYTEPGVTAADNVDTSVSVVTLGTVDTTVAGPNILTYTAKDLAGNNATPVIRIVIVQEPMDSVPPVITLDGANPFNLSVGESFAAVDPGATASDDVDGALTPNASGAVNGLVPGIYPITYTVSDTAGNAAKPVTRLVIVSDQDPPNIILSGNALVELEVGSDFTDPGAQADDAVDGEVKVTITGSVDTGTIGVYSLIYKASDASGNNATPVVRTIVSGGYHATSDLSQWFGQG